MRLRQVSENNILKYQKVPHDKSHNNLNGAQLSFHRVLVICAVP